MELRNIIPAVLTVALVGGAGLWYAASAPEPPPVTLIASAVTGQDDVVTVHVTGAVAAPGLVSIPRGSRVADAVLAAGGATGDADLRSLNLAAPVADGQHLSVPDTALGEVAAGGGGGVRLNIAPAEVLQELPGVGPVLAGRIVAHRDAHGPFTVVEDLLDVSGIGESKLAAIRDAVVIP